MPPAQGEKEATSSSGAAGASTRAKTLRPSLPAGAGGRSGRRCRPACADAAGAPIPSEPSPDLLPEGECRT